MESGKKGTSDLDKGQKPSVFALIGSLGSVLCIRNCVNISLSPSYRGSRKRIYIFSNDIFLSWTVLGFKWSVAMTHSLVHARLQLTTCYLMK